jgi:putative tryptophan/tyrosine transport system substrate-binding protein
VSIRPVIAVTLLLFVLPLPGEAQQAPAAPRLCFLGFVASQRGDGGTFSGLLEGLQELGYVEGRNITIDYLSADGRFERFPALADECVRRKADVIVTVTTPGALAAKRATTAIPIVAGPTGDPVGTGIVASLGRPGGNVTGLSLIGPGLSAKRLELLKEAVPRISRATLLTNRGDPIAEPQIREMEHASRSLGVSLTVRDVRKPDDLEPAFAAAAKDGDQGLLTTIESIFFAQRSRIVELAAQHRLPGMYPYRNVTDVGGLMSYGPSLGALSRRVAIYVDKILKGTKPADMPVEQPTQLELVINLKTARSLGLSIPRSLLLRADHLIQ